MKLKQIRVDGYKNLMNAVLELGDFNVLVGPNNSGKSNFLEALEVLGAFFFGNENIVKRILKGYTPLPRIGIARCHLEAYKNKPLTVGITFEIERWIADYAFTVKFGKDRNAQGEIVSETLTAKDPGKPGPAKRYFSRSSRELEVLGKSHKIAPSIPAFQALVALYPEFEGLPNEFERLYWGVGWAGITKVFCISPKDLRESIDSENRMKLSTKPVSSFDLTIVADDIKTKKKHYELFRTAIMNILDLEDVSFEAEDVEPKSDNGKSPTKRMRYFVLTSAGSRPAFIEEYSDGTLAVTAIVEALICQDERGPIFCIEELENCLHPRAQERLIRFLQEHSERWPVLLTTHSPYVLDCVKPEDVTVAVPDKTGAVHFEKIRNTKQLRDYLKSGFMSFGDMLASNFGEVLKGR